ncbi:MAG: YfdX family protein, partial [Desulfobacter sp.]|nr:YfdX family protein [Desulfobacter sp.]
MNRTLLATAIVLATTAFQPLSAAPPVKDIPSEPSALLTQVTAGKELITETQASLPSISRQALAMGREVYNDLLQLQKSAERRDEINTRLVLHDASRTLDSFYEPAAARALHQQAAIIHHDLEKDGGKPEPGLWLPLEAELDGISITTPAEYIQHAKQAVTEGHAAVVKGDRSTAKQRLSVLEDVLDYRWGLLPLNKIRGDIHSAELALNPDPPYWKGVAEAAKSALASVRWVTTTDASGWLSAYEEAVNARFALPGSPQRARSALEKAADNLSSLPGAGLLAEKAHKLADEQTPKLDS